MKRFSKSETILLLIMASVAIITLYDYWPEGELLYRHNIVRNVEYKLQYKLAADNVVSRYLQSDAFTRDTAIIQDRIDNNYNEQTALIKNRVKELNSYYAIIKQNLFDKSRGKRPINKENDHDNLALAGTVLYDGKRIALMKSGDNYFRLDETTIDYADGIAIDEREVTIDNMNKLKKRTFRMFMR